MQIQYTLSPGLTQLKPGKYVVDLVAVEGDATNVLHVAFGNIRPDDGIDKDTLVTKLFILKSILGDRTNPNMAQDALAVINGKDE